MRTATRPGAFALLALSMIAVPAAHAQNPSVNPNTAALDPIRGRDPFPATSGRQIDDWINWELSNIAASGRREAYKEYTERFVSQLTNPGNSASFVGALAGQTTGIAITQFDRPNLNLNVAICITRSMVELNRIEVVDGLLAALTSRVEAPRFLALRGLENLRPAIAAQSDVLTKVVTALRTAGVKETNPVVVGHVYMALGFPSLTADALSAYDAILDQRLKTRRGGAIVVDGAEIEAWEYFRTPAIASGLNDSQKTPLVKKVAAFLGLDSKRGAQLHAQREALLAANPDSFNPDLYRELDRIERGLDGMDELLASLTSLSTGGDVRRALAAGDWNDILAQVARWIGDADTNARGALAAAPWSVPAGGN